VTLRLAAACAVLLLPPAAARAQWTVEAAAGRAVHDPVSARVSTTSASLGVSYEGAGGWGYAAVGAPLQGRGPGWGAAGAGGWIGARGGSLRLGVSASADGYLYGESGPNPSGSGGTIELLPTLAWRRGPVSAELASGFAGAAELLGDSTDRRGFHDSAARLTLAPAEGLTLGGEARLARGEGGDWPYAGGSGELRASWGALWAWAGAWLDDDHPDPAAAYGVGVRLRVLDRTEIRGSVRQEPFDPLYWTSPRRTWSISLTRALGRRPGDRAGGSPLPHLSGGWAVFRLPRSQHPRPPVVLGDFSGWQPVAMTEEDGAWVARIQVAPGAYHYVYRTADGRTIVPPGVPSVDDGFGGRSAVLVVP